MECISDPYTIRYPYILAIADECGDRVELVESFDCIGGAMWAAHHYQKSPLVRSVRVVGAMMRYIIHPGTVDLTLEASKFPAGISEVTVLDNRVQISYMGIGGGGVGAAVCRASACGVIEARTDPSGGGMRAGSTILLPRRERLLIGVDDTDTPEAGATWTLAHNIARTVEDDSSRYLSHTIVQLYPVPYRTKNCVSVVCEFATTEPQVIIERFRSLLVKYTLSPHTGMAVFSGFDPSSLLPFGRSVKLGEVSLKDLSSIECRGLQIVIGGRGAMGAVAAIPFATQFEEALSLWNGQN